MSPGIAIPLGAVVFLNSDEGQNYPMTVGGVVRGGVLCRWHDELGSMQIQWFCHEEINFAQPEDDDEIEITFTPEASE